jgi:hypothetical protein
MCPNNFKPCAMFDINIEKIIIFPLNFIPQTIVDKYFKEIFVIFQMPSIFGNEWVKEM